MSNGVRENRDGFGTRLLLFVSDFLDEPAPALTKVKKGIWIAGGSKGKWVVKEFASKEKLQFQLLLSEKLFEAGFNKTYRFHQNHRWRESRFEGKLYGFIQYIRPSQSEAFHYESRRNREQALTLLGEYHQTTRKLLPELSGKAKPFDQLGKWERRLADFEHSLAKIGNYAGYSCLRDYCRWARWSLDALHEGHGGFLLKDSCIVHGDVVYHNFLLGDGGDLFLIDFDLAAEAPAVVDYLQFCNRILPSVGWSADRLFQHSRLEPYREERGFLCALVYPTDILREWNHFFRADERTKKRVWPYLHDITFDEYKLRRRFAEEIIKAGS